MRYYKFQLVPWSVKNGCCVDNVLDQTLVLSFLGTSFKDALQQLYKSLEFDKYIHANTTVWVYWKSCYNGKLYSIPQYNDIKIQ